MTKLSTGINPLLGLRLVALSGQIYVLVFAMFFPTGKQRIMHMRQALDNNLVHDGISIQVLR